MDQPIVDPGRAHNLPVVRSRFAALVGRTVVGWDGIEMAIRVAGPDGAPQFATPEASFLQLGPLRGHDADGGSWTVLARQADTDWGLDVGPGVALGQPDGIFRRRRLAELATGVISAVDLVEQDGLVVEATLVVGAGRLLLVAGEVEETATAGLVLRLGDESVLVFTDPDEADALSWTPARRRRE